MEQYDTSYSRTRQEATSKWSNVIKNSKLIVTNPIQIYLLNTVQEDLGEGGDTVRRYTFGQKDHQKRSRTILMVGETGTGKSSLINMMVNYMLGVEWEDNIRFKIISDESRIFVTESYTIKITAYEIYGLEELSVPFSLTVFDTPGFQDTRGVADKQIAPNLYKLLKSVNGVQQIDAVCLVVRAPENSLSNTQKYIFDAILSMFGKNIEKNLPTLITFSDWTPPLALNTVMNSGVPFCRDEDGKPVHFLFNNLSPETFAEQYKETYKTAWDKGTESMREFFQTLGRMETQSLRMTEYVLRYRIKLEACIHNLDEQIKLRYMKQKALEDQQKTLEELSTSKCNVVVMKKVKVKSKATCCTVCEVNCHYPGCWWATNLRWCSVMENNKCTVCPGKCSYTDHKKGNEIYVEEEKTGTLNKDTEGKILSAKEAMSKLQQEVKDSEAEMSKLIEGSFQSIDQLRQHALKFKSDSTVKSIRSLIEILKENKDMDKVEKLQKMLECEEINRHREDVC